MEILREGYVWIFEQFESGLKHWDKKYVGVDSNNYMYFGDDFDQFRCFTKGIYFDENVFEEEKQKELEETIHLFENNELFLCGQVLDPDILKIFHGTTQENNSNIFFMQFPHNINIYNHNRKSTEEQQMNRHNNILYCATTSEIELKAWLHHLKLLQKEYCKQNNIPIITSSNTSAN